MSMQPSKLRKYLEASLYNVSIILGPTVELMVYICPIPNYFHFVKDFLIADFPRFLLLNVP